MALWLFIGVHTSWLKTCINYGNGSMTMLQINWVDTIQLNPIVGYLMLYSHEICKDNPLTFHSIPLCNVLIGLQCVHYIPKKIQVNS